MTVFCENTLLQGAGINADTDRDILRFAGVGDRLDAAVIADVAGIDADLIHACGDGLQRELVIKMNVGDDRHRYRFFECGDQPNCLHMRNSGTDDLTSCRFQLLRLCDRAFDILGGLVQHRLDTDFSAAAYFCVKCGYIMFACHVNLR